MSVWADHCRRVYSNGLLEWFIEQGEQVTKGLAWLRMAKDRFGEIFDGHWNDDRPDTA